MIRWGGVTTYDERPLLIEVIRAKTVWVLPNVGTCCRLPCVWGIGEAVKRNMGREKGGMMQQLITTSATQCAWVFPRVGCRGICERPLIDCAEMVENKNSLCLNHPIPNWIEGRFLAS